MLLSGRQRQVVADTVAAPIEQQVNGVEGMLYMSSQCGNDGSYDLTVTFDLACDLNTALVMVQNRVSLAMPQLPDFVQRQGLTIKKKSPNILLVVNFFSPDGRYDDLYLSNYATIYVKDELFRLDGVGDIVYLGQRDYSIRAWLDPQRLASRNISANEIVNAIQNQNLAAAAGQIGQEPALAGQAFQKSIDTEGRLTEPEEFGSIVVKTGPGSPHSPSTAIVRLRDVGRVDSARQQYDQSSSVDGQPSVGLAIYQLPGTNALDVADRVRQKMDELATRFPDGLKYGIFYDTTPFIRRIGSGRGHHAPGGGGPGGTGGAGVLAELAGDCHPAGGRAGGHRGHFLRHGRSGLQSQQHLALRAGAGDRHRGRRRHRGGRERRALAGSRAFRPRRPPAGRWTK